MPPGEHPPQWPLLILDDEWQRYSLLPNENWSNPPRRCGPRRVVWKHYLNPLGGDFVALLLEEWYHPAQGVPQSPHLLVVENQTKADDGDDGNDDDNDDGDDAGLRKAGEERMEFMWIQHTPACHSPEHLRHRKSTQQEHNCQLCYKGRYQGYSTNNELKLLQVPSGEWSLVKVLSRNLKPQAELVRLRNSTDQQTEGW